MRAPLWFSVVCMTGCAVTMSHAAAAAEAHAITAIPRVSFTSAGPLLLQDVWLGVDNEMFAVDVRAPRCVSTADSTQPSNCGAGGRLARVVGQADASVTLKIPQWQRGAPLIDVTLRSSQDDARSDAAPLANGVALETAIAQSHGPFQWGAGFSQPLARSPGSHRQAAWIDAAARVSNGTTVRLAFETGRETTTGTRDFQYTLQATRALDRSLRARVYVSRLIDEDDRRWRAGVGLEWRF